MTEKTITDAYIDAAILGIDYGSLSREAIELARQVVLDGLSCAFAGSTEPPGVGSISVEYVREQGGAPQASVLGGGFKTSMGYAAYANGTMMHALLFDNSLYPPMHPTSPALPAILAIAEHFRLPGSQVIEAMVVAIEAQARLRAAATGLAVGKRFHTPGVIGTFGATAAAAKLLRLDRNQTAMALGLAGSRTAGMAAQSGTMTKPSHAGHAAHMGVECGILASMGWTASNDVFGPKGFFDTFMSGIAERGHLTATGAPLCMLVPGIGFKPFPCNNFTHRSIDGALALRSEHRIEPAQIDSVQVTFPDFDYLDRPQPGTASEGRFSAQYTTAVALLDGAVTVDSFTDERLHAPDMKALLPKVQMQIDKTIPFDKLAMYVIVEVRLKDGTQLSKRVDKLIGWAGAGGNPLTRDQQLAKYFSCARRVLDEKAANRILDLVEQLDTLPDVTEIMDLARAC